MIPEKSQLKLKRSSRRRKSISEKTPDSSGREMIGWKRNGFIDAVSY